jgi:hypothetical protein
MAETQKVFFVSVDTAIWASYLGLHCWKIFVVNELYILV